jgi:hypothetical protein
MMEANMSRDTTRKALNELRAVIGGGNTMQELKKAFGIRSFHEIADSQMEAVEAWAKRKQASQTSGSGKAKINHAEIYARWNARKAGAPVKPGVKDD